MLENDRVAGGATGEVVENKGARVQGGSGEDGGGVEIPRKTCERRKMQRGRDLGSRRDWYLRFTRNGSMES
jgi:hypothetical protein